MVEVGRVDGLFTVVLVLGPHGVLWVMRLRVVAIGVRRGRGGGRGGGRRTKVGGKFVEGGG
jgi:hypothetical protein